jgi:hypothetical protein
MPKVRDPGRRSPSSRAGVGSAGTSTPGRARPAADRALTGLPRDHRTRRRDRPIGAGRWTAEIERAAWGASRPAGTPAGRAPAPIETDPAIVADLIERSQASIATLRRDVRTKSGPARFDFLLAAFEEHKRVLGDPRSMQVIMAGMEATWWLNEQLQAWLGEKNAGRHAHAVRPQQRHVGDGAGAPRRRGRRPSASGRGGVSARRRRRRLPGRDGQARGKALAWSTSVTGISSRPAICRTLGYELRRQAKPRVVTPAVDGVCFLPPQDGPVRQLNTRRPAV